MLKNNAQFEACIDMAEICQRSAHGAFLRVDQVRLQSLSDRFRDEAYEIANISPLVRRTITLSGGNSVLWV